MKSLPAGGLAAVCGASGGIGAAVAAALGASRAFADIVELGRRSAVRLDLEDESSVAEAAALVRSRNMPLRLFFDATGLLHNGAVQPERSLSRIDPAAMAKLFAVNATGPALLLKHFAPLLPREGKSAFATLSAKVGSIGDNSLGGWVGYRASKAALNQIVRTAAVELKRSRPEAVLVALHPGTVDTPLSAPFAKSGLAVIAPDAAASDLLALLDRLGPADSGAFLSRQGEALPW